MFDPLQSVYYGSGWMKSVNERIFPRLLAVTMPLPTNETRLESGDVIVLGGTQENLAAAEN
ncbi:TrkA C-terminal domain-containing protein [Nitrosomonas sp. sh817]|uniref:TrkA C-terminal domain-containing protein n=1 Tax=Nitrosomonas sp. sh817 TaxID=3070658 RepID=UPI0027DE7E71|nr:TrkA C-terminal domain-containing protein [Nitrosomonas sp. sh817]WMJ09348.1 TrkA C-terminal domain-containing protein [Nitrosomonas sp. sh817]